MTRDLSVLAFAAGLLLAGTSRAQTITTIVETGMTLPGTGLVLGVSGVAVDGSGHALARAYTNASPNFGDRLVDEHGVVVAAAGQPVPAPAGALLWNFEGGNLNVSPTNQFVIGADLFGGSGGGAGIYYGLPLGIALEWASISTAPQLTPGSSLWYVLWPKINSSAQLCIFAWVDDPLLPGSNDTPAILVVDPAAGTQNVIAKRGDTLAGQTFTVNDLGANRHAFAFNDSGHVMFTGTTYASANVNKFMYLDSTKIGQMGDPSPFGAPFVAFSSVALNNSNEYAYLCHINDMDGQDGLVRNGVPYVQLGDSFPCIEPFKLSNFGTPLYFTDDGRLFWCASWTLPNGQTRMGIFVDYALIVASGSTVIHGSTVQSMTLTDGCFHVSPNGRYLAFTATLQGGVVGDYLIDLEQ